MSHDYQEHISIPVEVGDALNVFTASDNLPAVGTSRVTVEGIRLFDVDGFGLGGPGVASPSFNCFVDLRHPCGVLSVESGLKVQRETYFRNGMPRIVPVPMVQYGEDGALFVIYRPDLVEPHTNLESLS